eukprot:6074867-Amphidinium_carterae.1
MSLGLRQSMPQEPSMSYTILWRTVAAYVPSEDSQEGISDHLSGKKVGRQHCSVICSIPPVDASKLRQEHVAMLLDRKRAQHNKQLAEQRAADAEAPAFN